MNIFVSSYDPANCAKVLDDRRLTKMVLETAQLLSGAMVVGPLKLTHYNHPCAKWTRQSPGNFRWLFAHFVALLNEFHARYDKDHKYVELAATFAAYAENLEDGEVTPFVNVTKFKECADVRESYRLCLQDKWAADAAAGRPPTRYRQPFNWGAWLDGL